MKTKKMSLNLSDKILSRLTALEEKVEKLEEERETISKSDWKHIRNGEWRVKNPFPYCECDEPNYIYGYGVQDFCSHCGMNAPAGWDKHLPPKGNQEELRAKIEEELLGVCWNPECSFDECLDARKEAIDAILNLIKEEYEKT